MSVSNSKNNLSSKLIVKFINGKKYLFYMGNIIAELNDIHGEDGNVKTDFEQLENEDLRKALLGFYTDFHNNYISNYLDISKESYVIDSESNKFVLLRDMPISKVEQERLKRFINPYFNKDAKPLFAKHFDTYNVVDGQIIIDLNNV